MPIINGMVVLAPRRAAVPDHGILISHSFWAIGHKFVVPRITNSEWMVGRFTVGLNLIGRTESLLLRSPAVNASVFRADGSMPVFASSGLWPTMAPPSSTTAGR
jgi:hypothetical protein